MANWSIVLLKVVNMMVSQEQVVQEVSSIVYMYTGADINLQQQWLKKTSDIIRSSKNYTHGINKGDKSQCIISLT